MGRRRNARNHDEILKASYRLFMSRGYDNVSVLDIQNECGVQTRSLYRYFKSKDEILGTIIETIEKEMLEFLVPVQTGVPALSFVLFSIMKYEFAIANPDYFRMRTCFIARPDTFIKGFMELYSLSYPREEDWKSDESTMLQGLYVLGGMFLVQYGFIKNLSGKKNADSSGERSSEFDIYELSEKASDTYRRFMRCAIRNDLRILGLNDTDIESTINEACERFERVDVRDFRKYYENKLGFSKDLPNDIQS